MHRNKFAINHIRLNRLHEEMAIHHLRRGEDLVRLPVKRMMTT